MSHPLHHQSKFSEKTPTQELPPKLFTQNFCLLFTAHLFFALAFWPYVLLPVFLQDLGGDLAGIGIIMGTASIAGIAIRPWIGVALDRIGRRRCIMFGGLAFLTAHFFYPYITQIGWGIYIVRLFHGLGMGILIATFFTLAADISPPSRRTEGIALFGISGHIAGTIGVPLGERIIQVSGYDTLFNVCAGFTILSVVISYFIKEPHCNNGKPSFNAKRFLKTIIHPPNRVPLAATGLFALGIISYMVFLKPYTRSFGLNVSTFFLAYTLTAVIIRLIGGKWPDRFGLKTILYPSLFLLSSGIILLALRPSPLSLLISGILCGVGHGFIFPILSVLVLSRAPDSERGGRMTLFTLFFDIGWFLGSPLWGYVAKVQGYETMFFLSAMTILVSMGAFVLLDRSYQPFPGTRSNPGKGPRQKYPEPSFD